MKRKHVAAYALLCCAALLWNIAGVIFLGASAQLLMPTGGDASALVEAGLREVSVDEVLDAQLGLLGEKITQAQRGELRTVLSVALPLRRRRLEQGGAEPGVVEQAVYSWLSEKYEQYTIEHLGGDTHGWGYENPEATVLAQFSVDGDTGALTGVSTGRLRRKTDVVEAPELEEYRRIWEAFRSVLPQGALQDFVTYIVWTDGPNETLAFVQAADDRGRRWEIAIDPADVADSDLFLETILHEYCHYLTLNAEQADYTGERGALAYSEADFTSHQNSYLNAFYRRFWSLTLDDRRANMESFNFYLRHEGDFVSGYASTDPAEDIAESFAYFVGWDEFEDAQNLAEEKVLFFYEYEELVELRATIRANLEWN